MLNKENEASKKGEKLGLEGYARYLMRIAIAQLALVKSEQDHAKKAHAAAADGEQHTEQEIYAQDALLHALAEIAETFVRDMGRYSKDQAELAGRTQCNLSDVMSSLDRAMLVTQTSVRELALYSMREEIAFPCKLSAFPPEPQLQKKTWDAAIQLPSESEKNKQPAVPKKGDGPHMEPWMPPLPPAYTYVSTPAQMSTRAGGKDKQAVTKQRRQVEKELLKLTQRSTNRKKKNPFSDNPFLQPPRSVRELASGDDANFQSGDREILEPAVVPVSSTAAKDPAVDQEEPDRDLKRLKGERILATSSTLGSMD